ncbi:MAG: epimerase [Candidatus Accumulibacter sp. 66-26]|nr:NAD-dependent epimerase/dehydratase family protein [Accumulibacter sp.]OJW47997.1 MAG: epimerase [Candidatus Accumulibacter sp. 66-26]
MPRPLPPADLEHVLAHTRPLWDELEGARLFITGGTGFFGIWLLESLIFAREQLRLDIHATILSRSPGAFHTRLPHLAKNPALDWLTGDVRDFAFPATPFTHIIHGATEIHVRGVPEPPLTSFDTIVQGTRRVLDFALHAGARNVLLIGSGAVYGPQPPELTHIPEHYNGAPDCSDATSAYAEGKRAAELLGTLYAQQFGLETKIARCFTFVGPHLPMDKHFAIGNFMNDVLHGRNITVQGDGSPLRSYLHMADLVIWLLTILLKGQVGRPYNVGSDQSLNIAALAGLVADTPLGRQQQSQTLRPPASGKAPQRYVPDITRARQELGLTVRIPLAEAIRRTLEWHLP